MMIAEQGTQGANETSSYHICSGRNENHMALLQGIRLTIASYIQQAVCATIKFVLYVIVITWAQEIVWCIEARGLSACISSACVITSLYDYPQQQRIHRFFKFTKDTSQFQMHASLLKDASIGPFITGTTNGLTHKTLGPPLDARVKQPHPENLRCCKTAPPQSCKATTQAATPELCCKTAPPHSGSSPQCCKTAPNQLF